MTTNPARCGWGPALRWCGLSLVLAVTLGCGPGYGTVSGQVRYKGKPLPGGTLIFRPADTQYNPVSATVDADGHFQAQQVPAGEVQVSVDNRSLQHPDSGPVGVSGTGEPPKAAGPTRGGLPPGVRVGPPPGAIQKGVTDKSALPPASAAKKPEGTYVAIPDKYYDPTTSGISFQVTRGSQTHDITIE